MKKRLIKLMALILSVVIPISAFLIYLERRDDPYSKTYLGAFEAKYSRLYGTEGKKIIFIGGSSLPFGLRCDLIEQELEGKYEVINFGLYATLGTKFMMDVARDAIGNGDIVILAPELNAQTYSLYFNPEAVLQATNGLSEINKRLPIKEQLSLAYNYFDYAKTRIKYNLDGNSPDPVGVYRADSLNSYGDICVDIPNNIMNNGYDSNMEVYTDPSLLDEEFLGYVNEFAEYTRERGATLYFNYSPVNCLAIRSSQNARSEFEAELSKRLDCELLGTIEDYIIDERYFYDTNFHLNSDGAIYFSDMLVRSIKEQLGLEATTSIEVPLPPPLDSDIVVEVVPKDEKIPFDEYLGEPNIDYIDVFEYAKSGNAYMIVGVKDEYVGITEVILPSVYDGKNVTGVDANAFYGCAMLEYIHIGNTYKTLSAEAFAGCVSLKGIYMYEADGNKISPPAQGLLEGTPDGIKIYVPEGSNYTSGYTWVKYIDYFVTYTKGGAK